MRLLPRLLPRPCTYHPLRAHVRWKHNHLDMANLPVNKTAHPFDKARLEALLNRRFFYAPAFEIYGGEYFAFLVICLGAPGGHRVQQVPLGDAVPRPI